MKIDFTHELARLVEYASSVAIAIRMNSTYNGLYDAKNKQHGNDVMWLSDSLHNLDYLARAILNENPKIIIAACESLISSYELYINGKDVGRGDSSGAFDRHKDYFRLEDGAKIFLDIKAIASTYINA